MLLSNMRLNRKTGDRQGAGWSERNEMGNEIDGAGGTAERHTTEREM